MLPWSAWKSRLLSSPMTGPAPFDWRNNVNSKLFSVSADMRPAVAPQSRKAPRSSLMSALRDSENMRSEEHTSELQSLMRISYAVFCLKKKISNNNNYKISKNKLSYKAHQCNY